MNLSIGNTMQIFIIWLHLCHLQLSLSESMNT
uniref:Uncharacterized protein n=1 Tax=Rhizophora mucronata TaxID=61149 RepID=A0A2P2NRF1_RHIMU